MFTKGKWDAQPVRMEETTFKGPYCCIYAPGPMFPTCPAVAGGSPQATDSVRGHGSPGRRGHPDAAVTHRTGPLARAGDRDADNP